MTRTHPRLDLPVNVWIRLAILSPDSPHKNLGESGQTLVASFFFEKIGARRTCKFFRRRRGKPRSVETTPPRTLCIRLQGGRIQPAKQFTCSDCVGGIQPAKTFASRNCVMHNSQAGKWPVNEPENQSCYRPLSDFEQSF